MASYKKYFIVSFAFIAVIIAAFIFTNNYFEQRNINTITLADTKKEVADRSLKLTDYKTNKADIKNITKTVPVSQANKPSKFNFLTEVFFNNNILKNFKRQYSVLFPNAKDYSDIEGITCFRGNNFRNSASFGTVDINEKKLEKAWNIRIGYIDEWTGVGWTGQPSIVKWDKKVREMMNLYKNKKGKDGLKEVIYATLDGKIYFLDLDNGEATRSPIDVGFPHKGSLSIDPRGFPLLYAGQGIDKTGGKMGEIGFRIFNLINQKELYFINGMDPFALRPWGAFDSNALVDKYTDTLIECSENGILYTAKLNTKFDRVNADISIKPELVRYRYHSPKKDTIGMENSAVVYKNLIYFTDNSGTLQCLDLNTLSPLWVRDVTDDSDSTSVLEETSSTEVSLYTACEVDKQGEKGSSYIRKINALTGDLLWETAYKCLYDQHTNGGTLATPVVGKNDISKLIIYNIAKIDKSNKGKLTALDKSTGKEVWALNLDNYCWSSPVDVYTKEGKAYIVVCDSIGNMFLIEGTTGKIVDKISLEANIEGSPAVYDDMIVVGTRGQKIWGVRIR